MFLLEFLTIWILLFLSYISIILLDWNILLNICYFQETSFYSLRFFLEMSSTLYIIWTI